MLDFTCKNMACRIKFAIAILAVVLWFLSLWLPVFKEGIGGSLHRGYSVLFTVFALGIIVGIGIPWAALNVGFFFLFYINLLGKSSRRLAGWFSIAVAVLTFVILMVARDYPQWKWTGAGMLQIGVLPWTAAMFLIGIATYIPCPRRVKKSAEHFER